MNIDGQKTTKNMQKTVITTLLGILACGSFGFMDSEAVLMHLKDQIRLSDDPDDYTCWGPMHLLVERPNGKFVCVTPYAMMKLHWQPWDRDWYYFDVTSENGNTFSVFAHNYFGRVSDVKYNKNNNSLIVEGGRTGAGKLFVEIPKMLFGSPSNLIGLVGYVDGKEISDSNLLEINESKVIIEIPYEKIKKQVEIRPIFAQTNP